MYSGCLADTVKSIHGACVRLSVLCVCIKSTVCDCGIVCGNAANETSLSCVLLLQFIATKIREFYWYYSILLGPNPVEYVYCIHFVLLPCCCEGAGSPLVRPSVMLFAVMFEV